MHGSSELPGSLSELDLDVQNAVESWQTIRRIRHITAVQVRNLTPFPVRDAFASALKQPSEQPQFTPHGHLSDDLDLTIGRKHARRMSSTSSITLAGSRFDGDTLQRESDRSSEVGARKRNSSKASVPNAANSTTSASPTFSRRLSNTTAPTVRPPHRQRTISMASSSTSHTGDPRELNGSSSTMLPDLLRDTSQRGLEKVLQSRLVETFLTITLPPTPLSLGISPVNGVHHEVGEASGPKSPRTLTPDSKSGSRERASTLAQKSDPSSKTTIRRSTVTASSTKTSLSRPTTPSKLNSLSSAPTSPQSGSSNKKSASTTLSNGKALRPPASPPAHRQRSPIPLPLTSPSLPSSSAKTGHVPGSSSTSNKTSSSLQQHQGEEFSVPDYMSPVHKPSTNPTFQIDARSGGEFVHGADLTSSRMRVEVWGHVKRGLGWASARDADAKGKGKQRDNEEEQHLEWRMLEGWDVDLRDLTPLPEDLASHPSHLPSNALLVTLSPPGRTFYFPSPASETPSPLPSTSNSGYNSDPESDVSKVKSAGEVMPGRNIRWAADKRKDASETADFSDMEEYGSLMRKGKRRTATWQDLLRLINLQACIADTQQSLSDVVQKIDETVMQPGPATLRREVSERGAWIGQLRNEAGTVSVESEKLRSRISQRREDLRKRRDILALAREAHESDRQSELQLERELGDERDRLNTLRSQIGPMRSVLISTLSFIFPIELVSPPDLLFTILDVPLPIPIASTDPAPPLSLPSHKEVTEEGVATALGYAAQVVRLLAAYMGINSVYPVTCVGSRSLIKDGISAMVGPRMFPLFSRGVDTYRFEYGVFLLNKDIELLMSDRNLRALDMRHTLPNLKNLLLTLTDNGSTQRPTQRFSMTSSVSISSLQSPILTASALPSSSSDVTTPTATQPDSMPVISTDIPVGQRDSPPLSGATTPTASTADSSARKSRAFLDLTPLTGFLRARYPSSSRPSVRSVPESPEGVPEPSASTDSAPTANGEALQSTSGTAAEDDEEDDRRTIRGRGDVADDEVEEGKVVMNGKGNGHATRGENDAAEKVNGDCGHEHGTRSPGLFVGGVN